MDKTQEEQIQALSTELELLKREFFKNNFSSHQDFSKFSNFTTRLKVPHYDLDPAICEVGEIIEVGGVLKICSSRNVFTVV